MKASAKLATSCFSRRRVMVATLHSSMAEVVAGGFRSLSQLVIEIDAADDRRHFRYNLDQMKRPAQEEDESAAHMDTPSHDGKSQLLLNLSTTGWFPGLTTVRESLSGEKPDKETVARTGPLLQRQAPRWAEPNGCTMPFFTGRGISCSVAQALEVFWLQRTRNAHKRQIFWTPIHLSA